MRPGPESWFSVMMLFLFLQTSVLEKNPKMMKSKRTEGKWVPYMLFLALSFCFSLQLTLWSRIPVHCCLPTLYCFVLPCSILWPEF